MGFGLGIPECSLSGSASDGDVLGFSQDGGTIGDTLALLARAGPLAVDAAQFPLSLGAPRATSESGLPPPGEAIAWPEGGFGAMSGSRSERGSTARQIDALRYYDIDRDYQPGMQRRAGRVRTGDSSILELPATLSAGSAGGIIARIVQRDRLSTERLSYRLAAIDPAHIPGALVSVPGQSGLWMIAGWEWREGGVELDLIRQAASDVPVGSRDPGAAFQPLDRLAVPTLLSCFEVPFDGTGSPDAEPVYVAVSAADGRWSGAALYLSRNGVLDRLPQSAAARAVTGTLMTEMGPSPSLIFEPTASLTLELDAASMQLAPATIPMLAQGANRLLVGQEIVQFAEVEPTGERRWRLSGLLRGRGGTEAAAQSGQLASARAVLLDDALIALDGTAFDPATSQIAAIGLGDDTPVTTEIERPGLARRPQSPVHPAARVTSDGGLALGWTRRARGGWHWPDGVDLPLVEQSEQYEVGVGDAAAPLALWACPTPRFEISSAELSALRAQSADAPIWVRQIGTYGKSASLLLTTLA